MRIVKRGSIIKLVMRMIELLSKHVEDGDVDGCVNDDIRYEELDYNFCPLL